MCTRVYRRDDCLVNLVGCFGKPATDSRAETLPVDYLTFVLFVRMDLDHGWAVVRSELREREVTTLSDRYVENVRCSAA